MKKNKRKGEPKPAWPKRGSRACNDIFPIQLKFISRHGCSMIVIPASAVLIDKKNLFT